MRRANIISCISQNIVNVSRRAYLEPRMTHGVKEDTEMLEKLVTGDCMHYTI